MPTFTDENSALGEPNRAIKRTHNAPLIIGVLVATVTYLISKETGAHGICMPIGLFLGFCFTSICFEAEKERAMLIDGEDQCISSPTSEMIRPLNLHRGRRREGSTQGLLFFWRFLRDDYLSKWRDPARC